MGIYLIVGTLLSMGLGYAYMAGRHTKPEETEPEYPKDRHVVGRGPYPTTRCDGPRFQILGEDQRCEACDKVYRVRLRNEERKRRAWWWPVDVAKEPFVAMYEAGKRTACGADTPRESRGSCSRGFGGGR